MYWNVRIIYNPVWEFLLAYYPTSNSNRLWAAEPPSLAMDLGIGGFSRAFGGVFDRTSTLSWCERRSDTNGDHALISLLQRTMLPHVATCCWWMLIMYPKHLRPLPQLWDGPASCHLAPAVSAVPARMPSLTISHKYDKDMISMK